MLTQCLILFYLKLKEVYDLVNDPSETNNLVNSRPDIVRSGGILHSSYPRGEMT